MSKEEQAVRELVPKVYGDTATVDVERVRNGGLIRVLDDDGKRIVGWAWDTTSRSQNTEEQAWYTLLGLARDDMREMGR